MGVHPERERRVGVPKLVGNPADLNQLFLVTDVGVFRTDNGRAASPSWYRYMNGLPGVVRTMAIELAYDNQRQQLDRFTETVLDPVYLYPTLILAAEPAFPFYCAYDKSLIY